MNTQTNTIIDSISNDAKEIYWNAVNIINLEYKDILMDIEKHIDHVSYSNFISMLTSREKIYDEVIRKLKVTESLVYNLCGELMSVRSLIEKAKDYVVNSNYTKESNDAVDVFWDAVCYIDSNFKDILCLLEEHLELLELTGDPIERWSEWYSYERALIKTITENYMNRYSISNEIVIDEYGNPCDYKSLVEHAISHVGKYIPWENAMKHNEKLNGYIDWYDEYMTYTTPH